MKTTNCGHKMPPCDTTVTLPSLKQFHLVFILTLARSCNIPNLNIFQSILGKFEPVLIQFHPVPAHPYAVPNVTILIEPVLTQPNLFSLCPHPVTTVFKIGISIASALVDSRYHSVLSSSRCCSLLWLYIVS